MMPKALVVAGYTPVTLIVALMFWRHGDHSWLGAIHWAMFYFVGVVQPYIWARRALRRFERLGAAVAVELRVVAYYIVVVGALVLLVGMSLIREAARS